MEKKISYTTIIHQARKEMGITMIDYCIADSVYHLSNNPKNKGWCYASKEYLADFIGITSRGVFKSLNKLIEKNFIKREKKTGQLQTTEKWYKMVILGEKDYEQSSHSTMNKVHTDYEQSSYNNNINNNNNNIMQKTKFFAEDFCLKDKIKEMKKDRRKHIQLIAFYWELKNIRIKNKEEYQKELGKNLKAAVDLIELEGGSIDKAKEKLILINYWANSRKLDYSINFVVKKWIEIEQNKTTVYV